MMTNSDIEVKIILYNSITKNIVISFYSKKSNQNTIRFYNIDYLLSELSNDIDFINDIYIKKIKSVGGAEFIRNKLKEM